MDRNANVLEGVLVITYTITDDNKIEIDFHGVKPSAAIRSKMKAVKIWWDPDRMIWHGFNNEETLAVVIEICGEGLAAPVALVSTSHQVSGTIKKYVRKTPSKDYALKVKIKDIVNADKEQLGAWEKLLKDHVNEVMLEDNSSYAGNSVGKSQFG